VLCLLCHCFNAGNQFQKSKDCTELVSISGPSSNAIINPPTSRNLTCGDSLIVCISKTITHECVPSGVYCSIK